RILQPKNEEEREQERGNCRQTSVRIPATASDVIRWLRARRSCKNLCLSSLRFRVAVGPPVHVLCFPKGSVLTKMGPWCRGRRNKRKMSQIAHTCGEGCVAGAQGWAAA